MAGGVRAQPVIPRSVVSTGTTALHVAPPSLVNADARVAELSARGDHQTAKRFPPNGDSRSEPAHETEGGTRRDRRKARLSSTTAPPGVSATAELAAFTVRSPVHCTVWVVHPTNAQSATRPSLPTPPSRSCMAGE